MIDHLVMGGFKTERGLYVEVLVDEGGTDWLIHRKESGAGISIKEEDKEDFLYGLNELMRSEKGGG